MHTGRDRYMNLYAHQKKIIDEDPKKCGFWLGTGSGKTRVALMLAKGLIIVICPKTQKEDGNWEREWKLLNRKDNATLIVVSKEEFRRDHTTLPEPDTLIVDEAHSCLGVTPNIRWRKKQAIPKTSQLFEALESFIERTKPDRFYLCTATIIQSPMTVWAAAKLLGKHIDFYKFRSLFYIRLPMPGREVWQAKSDDHSKEMLAKLVRSIGYTGRLEDFFDVPEQTFRTVHVELTAKQKARIKEIPMEFPDPIVRVGKIHQIENGVLAGDEFNEPEIFENVKIDKILELALEFPRMVIFVKYTAQIGLIQGALIKSGYTTIAMTGQSKDRGTLIKYANSFDKCIFICQAQISAGWELPEYPVMVFASRTYSFVDYDQALGRIQRSNNIKRNLYINLVVKGGIDEAVDRCLINKQDFNEKIYAK